MFVRTVASVVFIVSGLAKAFDSDYFGNIMTSYGVDWFYGFAPLVVFAELLLGLALMFEVRTKYTAAAAAVLVLTFTVAYTYGVVVADVKDCGCFGHLKLTDSWPAAVYIRNAILLGGLIYVFVKSPSESHEMPAQVFYVSAGLVFAGAFICGNTFEQRIKYHRQTDAFEPIALSQHPLHGIIDTSADSTYMVTVFSYTCPHCINSIGNIEQYERFGVVDRVIGVSVENPQAEVEFRRVFRPSFTILNHSIQEVAEITVNFPVSYFIKRDSVVGVITGEVPSAYLFGDGALLRD